MNGENFTLWLIVYQGDSIDYDLDENEDEDGGDRWLRDEKIMKETVY